MIFVTALVDERTIWASDPKMHTFLVLEGTNNLFSLTTIKKTTQGPTTFNVG